MNILFLKLRKYFISIYTQSHKVGVVQKSNILKKRIFRLVNHTLTLCKYVVLEIEFFCHFQRPHIINFLSLEYLLCFITNYLNANNFLVRKICLTSLNSLQKISHHMFSWSGRFAQFFTTNSDQLFS